MSSSDYLRLLWRPPSDSSGLGQTAYAYRVRDASTGETVLGDPTFVQRLPQAALPASALEAGRDYRLDVAAEDERDGRRSVYTTPLRIAPIVEPTAASFAAPLVHDEPGAWPSLGLPFRPSLWPVTTVRATFRTGRAASSPTDARCWWAPDGSLESIETVAADWVGLLAADGRTLDAVFPGDLTMRRGRRQRGRFFLQLANEDGRYGSVVGF